MYWQLTLCTTFMNKFEAKFKNLVENKTHTFERVLSASEIRKRNTDIEGYIHLMLVYAIVDLECAEGKDLLELLVVYPTPVDSPLYNVLFTWNLTPAVDHWNPFRRVKFVRYNQFDPREPAPRG